MRGPLRQFVGGTRICALQLAGGIDVFFNVVDLLELGLGLCRSIYSQSESIKEVFSGFSAVR